MALGDDMPYAKAVAHFTTKAVGWRGAVRETVELILKAQGKWRPFLKQYAA